MGFAGNDNNIEYCQSHLLTTMLMLENVCKMMPRLVFQPPEMLKRMVPFNSSFKSNTKRQVIHSYHQLS